MTGSQGGQRRSGVTLHLSRHTLAISGAVLFAVILVAAGFEGGRLFASPASSRRVAEGIHRVRHVVSAGTSTTAPRPPSSTTNRTTTTTTTPTVDQTTTTAPPAPLPLALDCGTTPVEEPASLHWCLSACSPSMQGIHWRNWGTSFATGVGTWVTRTTTVPATTPNSIGQRNSQDLWMRF